MKRLIANGQIPILQGVMNGEMLHETAEKLGITVQGVKSSRKRIIKRLGVKHIYEAAEIAKRNGLIKAAKSSELNAEELQILKALADGSEQKQVANDMRLTFHIVSNISKEIRRKLGAKNMKHAIAIAFRKGILK